MQKITRRALVQDGRAGHKRAQHAQIGHPLEIRAWHAAQAIQLRQGIDLAFAALFFLLSLRLGVLSSREGRSLMTVRGAHCLTI